MRTATSLVLHELLAESAHSGHIASCTEFYYHQSSSIYHNSFHLAKTAVAKWPFILICLTDTEFYYHQSISFYHNSFHFAKTAVAKWPFIIYSINLLDRLLSNKSSSCYCYNPGCFSGCFLQVLLQSMNKKKGGGLLREIRIFW